MSNVINLVPEKASADEILEDAKSEFKEVLILGWDADALMKAKASSSLEVKDIIYMIEVFKQTLINCGYEAEGKR